MGACKLKRVFAKATVIDGTLEWRMKIYEGIFEMGVKQQYFVVRTRE